MLVVVGGLLIALFSPVETVELASALQIIVLGVVALFAGVYVWLISRGLTREKSEYLFLLVRRDLRVMLGLAMLAGLAVAVLAPRVLGFDPVIQRPWGTVWLVIGIDLFAVGLIDDALVMHRDRGARRG